MKKKYLFLALILLSILLFSCILTSKNPLGDYKTAEIDQNILGKWKFVEEEAKDGPGYLIVFKGNENHLIFLMFDEHYEFEEGYQGFISEIGKDKFINLKPLIIKEGKHELDKREEYILLHYKIMKNKLLVYLFEEDFFEEPIKNGDLKGEIVKSKKAMDPGSVTLTDSTENIVNYLKDRDVNEYIVNEESFVFEKVKKIPSPVPFKNEKK